MEKISNPTIDKRSGFCKSSSIFYSKRNPIALPQNQSVDVTTFISCRAHNGKIAFVDAATGRHLTFLQLWRAIDSVATCLSTDMGIRKGDVILLLSPNSIFFPVVCLTVMSLGAVITTTNPLNTYREIAKQIADSKPVLAFTTLQLVPKIAGSNLPIVLIDDEEKQNQSNKNLRIVFSLGEMMKKAPSEKRVGYRVDQDDTATLLYSSGTTGVSKGVVSSHRNLIATVQTILGGFSAYETFICTVSMFHIYGLVAFAMGFLSLGSTTVVLSNFELHDMLSAIEKYRATYLPLVPPILMALLNGGEVRFEVAALRAVRRSAAEQGGDGGVRGEVSHGEYSSGIRIDGVDGDRSLDGHPRGESAVRHGRSAVSEHGGKDRRS